METKTKSFLFTPLISHSSESNQPSQMSSNMDLTLEEPITSLTSEVLQPPKSQEDLVTEFYALVDLWKTSKISDGEGTLRLKSLITSENFDINRLGTSGQRPIHLVSSIKNEIAVSILLEHGADPNAIDEHERTPLHLAAAEFRGDKVVTYLLENGAEVDARDFEGWTALHIAARVENLQSIKLLLEHGADVNALRPNGRSALHFAAAGSRVDTILTYLLENGAEVDAKDIEGWTALHIAARAENLQSVKLLLEHGADTNAPLVDDKLLVALHLATSVCTEEKATSLLENGAEVDAGDIDGQTTLKQNADVNIRDSKGLTALHIVAAGVWDDVQLSEMLLEHNASVHAKTLDGKTALHIAAAFGNWTTCQLLLNHNSNAEARTNDGKSVVEYAKTYCHSWGKYRILRCVDLIEGYAKKQATNLDAEVYYTETDTEPESDPDD